MAPPIQQFIIFSVIYPLTFVNVFSEQILNKKFLIYNAFPNLFSSLLEQLFNKFDGHVICLIFFNLL